MNKYEVKIVNALLKKYYKRKSIYKDNEIHRRIVLPIDKVLKDYASYNVSLEEKELVNNAVHSLETKGFISSSKLKLSDDYQKLYLEDREIDRLEEFATKELGIIPRSFVADELYSIIEDYKGKGPITDFYINEIKNIIQNSSIPLDSLKEEEILKALAFLESNKEFLYIREASMLIYGDSKYLEISRRSQVCSVISRYLGADGEEVFEDDYEDVSKVISDLTEIRNLKVANNVKKDAKVLLETNKDDYFYILNHNHSSEGSIIYNPYLHKWIISNLDEDGINFYLSD